MATALSAPESPNFVSLDGRIAVGDWAKLPETKPHYKLIDGILKQKPLKTIREVRASSQLAFALHRGLESEGWQFFTSGTGLKGDEFNGFVPDVMGFTPETRLRRDAVYESAAYLVADVVSASGEEDRDTKMKGYAYAKVELFVLIDPKKKTFKFYRLENEKYGAPETLKDNQIWQPAELPGLQLELAKLWM